MPHELGHSPQGFLSTTPGDSPGAIQPMNTNNNQGGTTYRVYGTGESYSGLVLEIGGYMYTTEGGALEGDSLQLEIVSNGINNNLDTSPNSNPNPVTRTFVSRVTYYRQDGTPVARGTDLHQHQDGTIMLGHNPNNMGEIVTRTQPMFNNPDNQRAIVVSGTGGNGGSGNMGGGGY
tara:strand:+ start:45 stop:572 length:528 start_codon:yes stop_codon:yes gene_type:complete